MKYAQSGTGDSAEDVSIDLNDPCTLTFAVKYLNYFTKATPLSDQVTLHLSNETPLGKASIITEMHIYLLSLATLCRYLCTAVEYKVGDGLGHVRYYLAPKMEED